MQKETKLQHILLSVPTGFIRSEYHAVLISVLKRPNNKPLLLYMDSHNRTFESCELNYIVPYYVLEFIKQLDLSLEKVA